VGSVDELGKASAWPSVSLAFDFILIACSALKKLDPSGILSRVALPPRYNTLEV
jgi:hypothetical protein